MLYNLGRGMAASRSSQLSRLLSKAAAFYPLSEEGGSRFDAIGGINLEPIERSVTDGDVDSAAGLGGTVASFVGSHSEALRGNTDNALAFNGSPKSFTCFVKLDDKGGNYHIFARSASEQDYNLQYRSSNDRFRFWSFHDGWSVDADSLGPPSTGVWYFIHCWYDGADVHIQAAEAEAFDAATTLVDTTSGVSVSSRSDAVFMLGANPRSANAVTDFSASNTLPGDMAMLYIADGVLPEHEVNFLYNGGNGIRLSTARIGPHFDFVTNILDGEDVDGLQAIDMNGNGLKDLLGVTNVGTGGDTIYWLENPGSLTGSWTKHIIDDSFDSPEDINAADFDGDGKVEVIAVSQDGGSLSLFKQDGGDPAGTWSKTQLVNNIPKAQSTLIYDVDGDGDKDIVYAFEGGSDGEGGLGWLEYAGSDPTDAANWIQHTILQINGAWWIAQQGPADMSGDGNADDLVFGVREKANPSASGEVAYVSPPADPANPWTKTTIEGTRPYLEVAIGNFFGNSTDIVAADGESSPGGLFIFDSGNSFAETAIRDIRDYGSVAPIPQSSGRDLIFAFNRGSDLIELWEYDSVTGRYEFRAGVHDDMQGGCQKAIDRILYEDIDGSGKALFLPDGNLPKTSDNGGLRVHRVGG